MELTYVVTREIPPNKTDEDVIKFVPFTVMTKPGSPAVAELGEIEVVVGVGLFTVKVCALLVPPPGVVLKTVIEKVPAVNKSEAGMVAVS